MSAVARFGGLIISLFLASCAVPQPLNTPSGTPEVVIYKATKKEVIDRIVYGVTGSGGNIVSVNDYQATFSMPGTVAQNMFFGSRFNPTTEQRLQFNYLEDSNGGVRVFAKMGLVSNPGSGFERVNDMTSGSGRQLQEMLLQLKGYFDGEGAGEPESKPQQKASQ